MTLLSPVAVRAGRKRPALCVLPVQMCAPEGTRTPNLLIRRGVESRLLPRSHRWQVYADVLLVAADCASLGSSWGQLTARVRGHGRTGGSPNLPPRTTASVSTSWTVQT